MLECSHAIVFFAARLSVEHMSQPAVQRNALASTRKLHLQDRIHVVGRRVFCQVATQSTAENRRNAFLFEAFLQQKLRVGLLPQLFVALVKSLPCC